MPTVTYHCSSCFDQTLTRSYDVSHFSVSCPACGEFARFVHEGVLDQYEAFEASPPEEFPWDRLSRLEKFMVAEGIVRQGRSLSDFDVKGDEAED